MPSDKLSFPQLPEITCPNCEQVKSMIPKACAVEELSDATIQAISASKMDARHNHLGSLLK